MKKFLSLALAMAMVLSLFTMTTIAGARDFTDDESITYNEAIDVITAIGVVDGYTDGTFKPQEVLTRGAAAKIITNMILGPATASSLHATAAPFPDVPASHTFAPYIAYCAQNGIINGYSDGSFQPGGTLTGYAFLKMLLGALGYDGEIEHFTGANWSINVAKLADGIGLTNDLVEGFSGTGAVNRETACLFAFNTLKADLVEYDSKITANVNGVDVTIGGTTAAKSVTSNTQATAQNNWNIVNESGMNNQGATTGGGGVGAGYINYAIVQFGERYFPRLVRNDGKFYWNASYGDNARTDDLGRPASTWTYKGENIGTYVETPTKVYNGSVKIYEIFNDLGMTTATSDPTAATSGNVKYPNGIGQLIINGNPYAKYSGAANKTDGYIQISRSGGIYTMSLADLSEGYDNWLNGDNASDTRYSPTKAKIGDGTIVEVYHNELTNDVNICAISVYGGKITTVRGATNTRDDYVEFDYGGQSNNQPVNISSKTAFFEVAGVEEDDVVAYTYSDREDTVQSMYKMESVEGTLSERVETKSMTLGETVYKYAQEYTFETGLTETTLEYGSEYVVYLDANGLALWTEETGFAVEAYGVIQQISSEVNDKNGHLNDPSWTEKGVYGVSQLRNEPVSEVSAGGGKGIGSIWDGNRARILFADGSERTVYLDRSYAAPITGSDAEPRTSVKSVARDVSIAPATVGVDNLQVDDAKAEWTLSIKAGEVVRTRVDKNGNYRLYQLPFNDNSKNKYWDSSIANFSIANKGLSKASWNADSKTVFIVKVGNEWKVYTGIRNAPTVDPGGTAYAYITGRTAKIIFITDGTIKNTSKDVTFLAIQSVTNTYTSNDLVDYYVYNAVVRGQVTTVRVQKDATINAKSGTVGATRGSGNTDAGMNTHTAGVKSTGSGSTKITYWGAMYDTDWTTSEDIVYATQYDNTAQPKVANGNGRIRNSEITLDTNTQSSRTYPVAAGAQIYNVTKKGEITKVTDAAAEVVSSRDTVVLYTMDDGEITNLFIIDTNAHD